MKKENNSDIGRGGYKIWHFRGDNIFFMLLKLFANVIIKGGCISIVLQRNWIVSGEKQCWCLHDVTIRKPISLSFLQQ